MQEQFRLLSVHAHPDDESSKGSASVAKYSDAGVHNVLVCCTGGEEGDIINEEMNRPEIVENLGAVRRDELTAATDIIGYHNVIMLGYRDSGMKDSEANSHPDCFAAAPLGEAVARLATIVRAERPHVVMSYGPARGGYEHPDHERVYEITLPALELAASDSTAIDGEPWQVLKLYTMSWSRARMLATHEKFLELGLESPFSDDWFSRPSNDHLVTTKVPITAEQFDRRCDALLAHKTQVDPNSPFWFGLPRAEAVAAYPYEDYELVFSRVESPASESDLFAGITSEALV